MIREASEGDFNTLIDIWDSAVSATHHFLSKEDFSYYKSRLPLYFKHVKIYVYWDKELDIIKGFLGVSEDKIEMLFIDDLYRKQGIGTELIMFAINVLHVLKVDVNEDNKQALQFYKGFGFKQIGYSEKDSEDKNYPIIFMGL